MTELKSKRVIVGCMPTENFEPVLLLRGSDPAASDVILTYLRNLVKAEDADTSAVQDVLNMFFLFKAWQMEHGTEGGRPLKDPDAILCKRILAWIAHRGGFVTRTEMLRRYHAKPDHLDRVAAPLELRTFRVQTTGRPTTWYVLHDCVEAFQQYAQEQGLSFCDDKTELTKTFPRRL